MTGNWGRPFADWDRVKKQLQVCSSDSLPLTFISTAGWGEADGMVEYKEQSYFFLIMPALQTLVSKSKISSNACSFMCLHQGSRGHPLPLDGFSVWFKCHCCPCHSRAVSHLSTDIVIKLFIMKPNGEKQSPLKQLLFLCLFFSLWQLCFLYRQAIMRNCIKSVWQELIWAPFICFPPPSFFWPQTCTQACTLADMHTHRNAHTENQGQ